MRFSEAKRLLDPTPMLLETGVERLPGGGLHVAILSLLEKCTADMFDYWFGSEPDTNMYKLWHPGAHISSEWGEFTADHVKGKVHGSTHLSREDVGGGANDATLAFINPVEIFGDEIESARAQGNADVVFYASCAMGPREKIIRDDKGRPIGDQQVIVGRDTPYGLVVRTHFWLGDALMLPLEEAEKIFPLEMGLGIMNHGANEFHILGKVIPSYYLRDRWQELGGPEPFSKNPKEPYKVTPRIFG